MDIIHSLSVFIICHLPHYNDAQRFWQQWPHWKFALLIPQSTHWQFGFLTVTHVTWFCIRLRQIRLQTWLPVLLSDDQSFRNFSNFGIFWRLGCDDWVLEMSLAEVDFVQIDFSILRKTGSILQEVLVYMKTDSMYVFPVAHFVLVTKIGDKNRWQIWNPSHVCHQTYYSLIDHEMAMSSCSYFYEAIHLVLNFLIVR